ncbi:MAG: STAS domain-containing protein [Leptospiraceae bacterium]|nr:STAS domain-containing protein [Leptospiraceae bacterium]
MEFSYREENGCAIFTLSGRVHLYEIQPLRDKFEEIRSRTFNKIIVDMGNVEHIDSSGIGILIAQASRYKERDIPFILVGIRKNLEHLFRLTSFSTLFVKLHDVKEALKY